MTRNAQTRAVFSARKTPKNDQLLAKYASVGSAAVRAALYCRAMKATTSAAK